MKNVHPLAQEYVDDVCKQVKAKELLKDIQEELAGHLDELMDFKRAQGLDDDAAAKWAIAQMGDTQTVAEGLNQVHKPRIPWAILGSLALLLAIALVTMYGVELSYKVVPRRIPVEVAFFIRQAVYIALGLGIMFTLSRIHYRTLFNFSWTLYGATIVLLSAVFKWGLQMNGAHGYIKLGSIPIDVVGISPYFFIASAAGLLCRRQDSWRAVIGHTILFTVAPLVLYTAAPSFSSQLLYSLSYALLLYISRCGWRWMVPHISIFTTFFSLSTFFSGYGRERLTGFFHSHEDAAGAGYMYIQIDEAVRSAGWWGHGFSSITQRLPNIYSEFVFTYIVYSLGWVFGAFVLLSALLFVNYLVKAALSVHDTYGKMLISGLGGLFAVQFVWSMGMSLGVLPISSVILPFISYGESGLLVQLGAIGIIYSVYRRKDMIPTV